MTTSAPVVIVGGGYAGLAAAVTLAEASIPVHLIEAASMLGGRARRIETPMGPLDNGQHLLLGAYRSLLTMIDRVHAGRSPLTRLPLRVIDPGRIDLRPAPLPSPWHLLWGLAHAHGLPGSARLRTIAFWRRLRASGFTLPDDCTVATLLASQPPAVIERLWAPLCVAALNTPPEDASAAAFLAVVRAAFDGSRRDSDFLVPNADLSELFPEPARRLVERGGGRVDTGRSVVGIGRRGARGWLVRTRREAFDASSVIVAVGAHQLGALASRVDEAPAGLRAAASTAEAMQFEPIVTVYLRLADPPPLPYPVIQLDRGPGEWLVDRGAIGHAGGCWAVVASAARAWIGVPRERLVGLVVEQLSRRWPGGISPVASYVVSEKRATYRCAAGQSRPTAPALGDGLFLAGDYAHPIFPATLESAAATGIAAARAVMARG